MIEPVPYRKPDPGRKPYSIFRVNVTPDGWKDAGCVPTMVRQKPNEIIEETRLIKDLIKLCPTFDELRKYFGKHGKQIRCEGPDPTLAITVEKELSTYNIEATGPYLEIVAYRKGK